MWEEILIAGMLFFAVTLSGAAALMAARQLYGRRLGAHVAWIIPLIYGGAALLTRLVTRQAALSLALFGIGILTSALAFRHMPSYSGEGRTLLIAKAQAMLATVLWEGWIAATLPVAGPTRALLFLVYGVRLLVVPSRLVQVLESWEVLCRTVWRRPRAPLWPSTRSRYPRVSIHVPMYAEPPEVVIGTLDALARLRYPSFEVIAIDNNTRDPALWRPVEAHCRALGERFRFMHFDTLEGAKPGALNVALRETTPDAELVAVVDCDYQVEPEFLEELVGYFDDPEVAFVQTPHGYREWEDSLYQRMCYWEYELFYGTAQVSRNERNAAVIVGTMCIVRRSVLEELGGWATWCVTEDTELSLRIHQRGYQSVYLNRIYGRGLIPETFGGYKKQRFRWAYGAVQQLRPHLRSLLPFSEASRLTLAQKIRHFGHSLERVNMIFDFLLTPLGLLTIGSLVLHGEEVPVPFGLIVASIVLSGCAQLALDVLAYRVGLGASALDALAGLFARRSLSYVVTIASIWAVLTRQIRWHRTSKFKSLPGGLAALSDAKVELALGLALLLPALGALLASPGAGLMHLILLGIALQSTRYLCAPIMALIAERDLRASAARPPGDRPRASWMKPGARV